MDAITQIAREIGLPPYLVGNSVCRKRTDVLQDAIVVGVRNVQIPLLIDRHAHKGLVLQNAQRVFWKSTQRRSTGWGTLGVSLKAAVAIACRMIVSGRLADDNIG
jgi:hypothetical protein